MSKCNETLMILQKYRMENLLCIICRNLLNDICQGQCGCLYCKECFELYFNHGKICPGSFEKCKMDEIKIVENKSLYEEQLTAFLQWILQMNKYFSLYKNNIKLKEMKSEFKLIKKILYSFQRNFPFWKLDDNENNKNIVKIFLIAIEELREQIKNQIFEEKYVLKSDKKFDLKYGTEFENHLPKSLFNQPNLDITRNRGICNSFQIARFNWIIDDFWKLRDKNRDVCSDNFQSLDKQYEMRLYFYPNGSDYHNDWQFGVRLWMEDGPKSLYRWPFIGFMKITLKNKSQKIYKSLEKQLSINISLLNPCGRSDLFTFNYSDISLSDDSMNKSVIIECSITS